MFDFSILYTNIPHYELKSVMGELIFNFYFNGEDSMVLLGPKSTKNTD